MGNWKTTVTTTRSGRSLSIRIAQPEDATAAMALFRSVVDENQYLLATASELTHSVADEAEWLSNERDHPDHLVLVATIKGQIVGMLDFANGHRERIAHTGQFGIVVHANHRGDGVGTALMHTLIDWALAHPVIEKINLMVHADNGRAIDLYHQLGFVSEGRRHRELKYGENHYVDAVLMARFVNESNTDNGS